ncbi:Pollen Ole e 1 allergen/extensin [Melia azedarach]|uniref:Pollen Ole e 1 allergen/extensin n=1 Tax=Melia azedarach TaxID=155640 RepID=A0ACC1Y876_MELAZ|nr:Pollen Ole e 1 allergen/extensin [Melia azedarach]
MALTRFFFVTCLLLLPLLIIASANDYYSYSSNPDDNKPKSEKEDQGHDKDLGKAESEDRSKSKGDDGYDTKPDIDKKLDQGYDKDLAKAEAYDKSKSKSDDGYDTKPDVDKKLDQGYDKNLEKADSEEKSEDQVYKPKSEDKSKSENYGYDSKPDQDDKSKREDDGYDPKLEEKEKSFLVGIQGLVLCKSGPKYYPIPRAVARITCLGVDENGYEKKSVFNCRGTTDEKGYFFAKLSPLELTNSLKLTECNAFLEKSPSEICKIPTDVKKRVSGALLTSYRILNDNKVKLYSLKPFFFTSENESTPSGY